MDTILSKNLYYKWQNEIFFFERRTFSYKNSNDWFNKMKNVPLLSEKEIDILLQHQNVNTIFDYAKESTILIDDQRDLWQYQKDRKVFRN